MSGCSRRWRRLAVLGVGLSLLSGARAGALPPVRIRQVVDLSVANALDELAIAQDERIAAEEHLAGLRERAAQEATLHDGLSEERRTVLGRLERAQSQARSLAVEAYIHGSTFDALETQLDAEATTAAAFRQHLTTGRIDRAREAAARLRTLRGQVDQQLNELAGTTATLQEAIADAEVDVRQATQAELRASQRVEAAREAEARDALRREQERSAARAAALQRQQDAERAAATVPNTSPRSPTTTVTQTQPTTRVVVNTDPWEYLRQCESGGNYRAVSPDGLHRGAYQFDQGTWEALGGRGDPAAAPPAEQDARAYALYLQRGRSPWPTCGRYLP